jgi:hypothetical protein
MLVAIISVASLSFPVILSRQQRQIDRLIEENAIMAAELRELRWEQDARTDPSSDRPAVDHSSSDATLDDSISAAMTAPEVVADSATGSVPNRPQ